MTVVARRGEGAHSNAGFCPEPVSNVERFGGLLGSRWWYRSDGGFLLLFVGR
jgi:hypothetical protein